MLSPRPVPPKSREVVASTWLNCAKTSWIWSEGIPMPVSATRYRSWSPRSTRRSEEHTSELQSRLHLVCRLLLEKKKENLRKAWRGPHNVVKLYCTCCEK